MGSILTVLAQNALHRNLRSNLKTLRVRVQYFARTGYLHTSERSNPDFPNRFCEVHIETYKFISTIVEKKKVLDVGCGVGFGSAILANTAAHVTAIDTSSHALRFAKKKYSRPNVEYTKMDAHHLSFADRCFDVVISSEVFEHLPNQKQHLREVRRVLNENGFCFVGVPHPERTGNANKFHAKENTPEEMRELLLTVFGDVVIVDPRQRNERQEIFGINVKVPHIPDCISFFCFAR